MHVIRNWDDAEAHFAPFTQAELMLKEACATGAKCTLDADDTMLPDLSALPEREIRADILRFFILGGEADTETGVRLSGAYVSGTLDLSFSTALGVTEMINCQFEKRIVAIGARFELLTLRGSTFSGLAGNGARFNGNLFLRNVVCTGRINLTGAQIEGQLVLQSAKLEVEKGFAFVGQHTRVQQGFYWVDVEIVSGDVSLSNAHVSNLRDDLASWPGSERLYMDGFTYDRITDAPTDADARIGWLKKGSYWQGEFYPQPFTQMAKVLREMGHDSDARKVLARREHLLREHERERMSRVRRPLQGVLDWLLQKVIGYGHHPFRSITVLLLLIALTTLPAEWAWQSGDMAPNSAPILVSEDWIRVAAAPKLHIPNPAAEWGKGIPGKDWETFFSLAYAADVVIPIINFGQTDAWAPSTERSWAGWVLWWWRWIFSLLGWIVTALGAAAITGYVSRD